MNYKKDNGFSFTANSYLKIEGNQISYLFGRDLTKPLMIYPTKLSFYIYF